LDDQPVFVYVSLLPNQTRAATRLLVDDFELAQTPGSQRPDRRQNNLIVDGKFGKESIAAPWYFAPMGGKRVMAEVKGDRVHMKLPAQTSNYESGQLWQHVRLEEGVRYRISCEIAWLNHAVGMPAPIVNLGLYHEATHSWHGPVDQVLKATPEATRYSFDHIPTLSGPWKFYLQLNGWGNFGNALEIAAGDVQIVVSEFAK
jgi:hypothetical protein